MPARAVEQESKQASQFSHLFCHYPEVGFYLSYSVYLDERVFVRQAGRQPHACVQACQFKEAGIVWLLLLLLLLLRTNEGGLPLLHTTYDVCMFRVGREERRRLLN